MKKTPDYMSSFLNKGLESNSKQQLDYNINNQMGNGKSFNKASQSI